LFVRLERGDIRLMRGVDLLLLRAGLTFCAFDGGGVFAGDLTEPGSEGLLDPREDAWDLRFDLAPRSLFKFRSMVSARCHCSSIQVSVA
jgi:hypothetical protein